LWLGWGDKKCSHLEGISRRKDNIKMKLKDMECEDEKHSEDPSDCRL